MCTDISLGAIDIIRLYGLRFKIEHSFKQAIRLIGSFAYHFWMKAMVPLRHRNGNQYLHRQSSSYRDQVKRKVSAYHVFIQAGVVAQGLLQYLAVVAPKLVWASSDPGCEPFAPAFRPPNWSLPKPCARRCPILSWFPAKSALSQNSSQIGKTLKI
jgi:hypothetical protein